MNNFTLSSSSPTNEPRDDLDGSNILLLLKDIFTNIILQDFTTYQIKWPPYNQPDFLYRFTPDFYSIALWWPSYPNNSFKLNWMVSCHYKIVNNKTNNKTCIYYNFWRINKYNTYNTICTWFLTVICPSSKLIQRKEIYFVCCRQPFSSVSNLFQKKF